jgi:hypothetical protein
VARRKPEEGVEGFVLGRERRVAAPAREGRVGGGYRLPPQSGRSTGRSSGGPTPRGCRQVKVRGRSPTEWPVSPGCPPFVRRLALGKRFLAGWHIPGAWSAPSWARGTAWCSQAVKVVSADVHGHYAIVLDVKHNAQVTLHVGCVDCPSITRREPVDLVGAKAGAHRSELSPCRQSALPPRRPFRA